MNVAKAERVSPNPQKPRKEPKHWSQRVSECIVSAGPEGNLSVTIKGGADSGQFNWLGEIRHDRIHYHSGKLHQDDIILEIQGQKVAGYTLRDLETWLGQVSKNAAPVMFKTVKSGKNVHEETDQKDRTKNVSANTDRSCLSRQQHCGKCRHQWLL